MHEGNMNILIRLLYAILIAAAVVSFVAVSIYTFYPGPTMPDYNPPLTGKTEPATNIDDAYQRQYEKANQQYQTDMKSYQRNVSIILVFIAAVVIALGIWLLRRSDIIGEGLQLGAVGTSIYAVISASVADDRVMRFVAVTAFLASVIIVVYVKFNEKPAAPSKTKKA